jgi:hypothetical protein
VVAKRQSDDALRKHLKRRAEECVEAVGLWEEEFTEIAIDY